MTKQVNDEDNGRETLPEAIQDALGAFW